MRQWNLRHGMFALVILTLGSALMAQTAPATQPTTQKEHRYEKTIQKFEAQDKETPPPQHAILFVGSSTFTRWKDIEKDFPGLAVFNRGFGGSTMADLNHFMDRIVLPYKPAKIVVYEGTNDITGKQAPETVFGNMKKFHEKIRAELPGTQIYFLPLIPAPTRIHLTEKMDEVNAMIKEYVSKNPDVHYIDARGTWLDADGKPDEKLYVKDRLHPSREAYEMLIPIIRKAIDPASTQPAR